MDNTYDNNMPTRYTAGGGAGESNTETIVDTEFIKGPKGILKAVEAVLALVCFICAVASSAFLSSGGGWVAFVGMSAFIINIVWYLLYAFRIINKLPPSAPWHFIMFVYCVVYTVFFFISGVVSAARGSLAPAAGASAELCYEAGYTLLFFTCGITASVKASNLGDSAAGAAAFFCFVTMVAYGADCYFVFVGWRASGEGPNCLPGVGGGGGSSGGGSEMPNPVEDGRKDTY